MSPKGQGTVLPLLAASGLPWATWALLSLQVAGSLISTVSAWPLPRDPSRPGTEATSAGKPWPSCPRGRAGSQLTVHMAL